MRRFYGLFFLILMLLSTFGYFQFLVVVEQQLSSVAARRIVEHENEISGNLVLRVPMSLPYGNDDDVYRTAHGEILIDGDLYRFVKQKIYRDTLYLVCFKDAATTGARKAISDFSRSFAGQDHQKPDPPRKATGSFFPPFYLCRVFSSGLDSIDCVVNAGQEAPENLYRFSSTTSVFHPPC